MSAPQQREGKKTTLPVFFLFPILLVNVSNTAASRGAKDPSARSNSGGGSDGGSGGDMDALAALGVGVVNQSDLEHSLIRKVSSFFSF